MSLNSLRTYAKSLRRKGVAVPAVNALQVGWNYWKNTYDFIYSFNVVSNFNTKSVNRKIPDLVDLILDDFNGTLAPIQNRNELTRWIEMVAALSPDVIVEIGTAKGGTFILMSQACSPTSKLVSIDLPGGFYGGGYPAWKETFFRKLIGEKRTVSFIRANSHDTSTLHRLEEVLGGKQIDILFIDGDHSYAGAKNDFLQYAPFVRPGGLIALHDIVQNRFDPDIDVHRLWDEIKLDYAFDEIIADGDHGKFGIGVVHVAPQRG